MKIDLVEITNKIHGNKHSISLLLKGINNNNDSNVWMLNGPKGIGKASIIKLISSNLLNIKYNHKEDENFFHPDLKILKREKKKKFISVDEIRELKKLFFKTSFSEGYRIAVIDSINELNLYGHNALLKTIEEPPKNTYIFIINHQNGYVPATVKSRCKLLNFNKISNQVVLTLLEKMNFSNQQNELNFYSEISNGSVGDAIYFIEKDSLSFYKNLCKYLINIQEFNEIDTHKIIKKILENKNNLTQIFFKLFNILIQKVIKKKFLNQNFAIIEEEKLLIEKLNKLCSKKNIFLIIDSIGRKYNSYIDLNTDLHSTLYSLLMEIHNNVKKNN